MLLHEVAMCSLLFLFKWLVGGVCIPVVAGWCFGRVLLFVAVGCVVWSIGWCCIVGLSLLGSHVPASYTRS